MHQSLVCHPSPSHTFTADTQETPELSDRSKLVLSYLLAALSPRLGMKKQGKRILDARESFAPSTLLPWRTQAYARELWAGRGWQPRAR